MQVKIQCPIFFAAKSELQFSLKNGQRFPSTTWLVSVLEYDEPILFLNPWRSSTKVPLEFYNESLGIRGGITQFIYEQMWDCKLQILEKVLMNHPQMIFQQPTGLQNEPYDLFFN